MKRFMQPNFAALFIFSLSANIQGQSTMHVDSAYGNSIELTTEEASEMEILQIGNELWSGYAELWVYNFKTIPLDHDEVVFVDGDGVRHTINETTPFPYRAKLKTPVSVQATTDNYYPSEIGFKYDFLIESYDFAALDKTVKIKLSDQQLRKIADGYSDAFNRGAYLGEDIGNIPGMKYMKVGLKAELKIYDNFARSQCLKIGLAHHNEARYLDIKTNAAEFTAGNVVGHHSDQFSIPLSVVGDSHCGPEHSPEAFIRKQNPENENYDIELKVWDVFPYAE